MVTVANRWSAVQGAAFSKAWPVLLASFAAFVCIAIHVAYLNRPILEEHAFRQTHTALTAYWMVEEGWRLDYQTPVVGHPWAIPFEFPIYQSLVAFLSSVFKLPLEATGRTVSLLFLLAMAWSARLIARELALPGRTVGVFCALLWTSPLYLFWGRSFMMETTVLFFTLAAIPYCLRLRRERPRVADAWWACAFGSLAMLHKVTTAAPVLLCLGVVVLYAQAFRPGFRMPAWRTWACLLLAFAAPLVFSVVWTRYTDELKQANEFGKTLTSTALIPFNFGALADRFSFEANYQIFWHRLVSNNIAGFLGLSLIGGALLFGTPAVRRLVLFCLLLWVLPILIFYNLHRIHNYYQCASLVFLVAALAVAVTVWLPAFGKNRLFAPFCAAALLCSNLVMFATNGFLYKIKQQYTAQNNDQLALCKIINDNTPRRSAVVVFGDDWSGATAFYSQRKAMTVVDWWCAQTDYWNRLPLVMGDRPVSAVVLAPSECVNVKRFLDKPEIQARPQVYRVHNAYLWLPGVSAIRDPFDGKSLQPLAPDSLAALRRL